MMTIPLEYLYKDIEDIVGSNKANMIIEKLLLKYPSSLIYVSKKQADRIAFRNAYIMLSKQKKSKRAIVDSFIKTFQMAESTAYRIISSLEEEIKNEL